MSTYDVNEPHAMQMEEDSDGCCHLLGQYPLSSALTAFGLGVATGVLVAATLPGSRREEEQTLARRISRQVLEGVSGILPEALSKRLS